MAYKDRIVLSAADIATESANTEVTLTYAAIANRVHSLFGVVVSYSGAPTGGRLRVQRGTTTVFDLDVVSTELPIMFPQPIGGELNEAMNIVLAAGGAGVVGKISALHKATGRFG